MIIELSKGTNVSNLSPIKQTWINFLKSSTENISKPIEIEEIHKAYEKVSYTTKDNKYRNYIDAVKRTDQLYAGNILLAREEALEEGREKGKLEEQKQIALNMKKQGFDNDTIAKYLNIDVSTLQGLLNN